jgi:hypothetical protein
MDEDRIDPDVEDVMAVEKRRGRSNRPTDPFEERKRKAFAAGFTRAIKSKDPRKITELLKLYEIPENSPEAKRAWKIFLEALR